MIELPAPVVERVRSISRGDDLMEYVVYLSFLYALLYRYYGAENVCLSTPDLPAEKSSARENHLLFFKLAGVDSQTTIKQLLKIVLQEVRETTARREFDFAELQDGLARRHGDAAKLYQFGIYSNRVNAESEAFDRVALQFRVDKQDDLRTALEIRFDAARHAESWGEQLASHYRNLLSCVGGDLEQKVGALPLLSPEEESRLLAQSAGAARPYAADKTIHELFEAQAALTPDADAVVYDETTLSYRDLNEKANQLAHLLRGAYGVGPGEFVGLMLNRSELLPVGVMGVLKAGAAYVPVDPAYPLERRSYLLKDSGVKVLVSEDDLAADLEFVARLDIRDDRLQEQPLSNPEPLNCAGDLIYAIYTSGTTGRPKGVMVEHRSVVNLCAWLSDLIYQKHESPLRVSVNASISFDSSVKQLFPPLLSGSCLVVIPEAAKRDPELFADTLLNQRVEVLDATPSYLSAVLAVLSTRERRPNIRYTLAGGEALDRAVRSLYGSVLPPQSRLVNVYGITEVTVDSTFEVVEEERRDRPTIGRPIWNTQIHLMDAELNLAPPGVAGEICIGGDGLARGYLRRPDLTAERFVANPFADGERLYRTGDIARRLPDGTLEFLGRRDHQVKVRGFRVELREVEHAMLSLAGVRQALVITAADSDGSPQLVAYYTADDAHAPASLSSDGAPADEAAAEKSPPADEALEVERLRGQLRRLLPDYMLPAFLLRLPRFPLTPNGKVDRSALPPPRPAEAREYVAPRTPTEKGVAAVWERVLGVERVGVGDDFFALGGHSLKATRVVALLYREMGLRVELRSLFLHPTLKAFAEAVASRGVEDEYRAIKVVAEREDYELSHAQRRLWVLDQLEGGAAAYTMAGAYRLAGEVDRGALGEALRGVVERHESLRTVFVTVDGEPRQRVLGAVESGFALRFTDLRGDGQGEGRAGGLDVEDIEARAAKIIEREAAGRFDLAAGPLLRAHLLRLADRSHLLVLAMHHIVGDGHSVSVLMREALALYRARRRGESSPLAPLRIQYKDYANWQNERLRAGLMDEQRRYWLERLAPPLPVLELTPDFARPPVKSNRGGAVRRRLDAGLTQELRRFTRETGSSLFMALAAGVGGLLWRQTGQDELVMGTPVAGRVDAELEGQVGFYVNTLALRVRVEGGGGFAGLVGRVKEAAVEGYERQEYPFDLLVEELGVERDLSRSAVFDVMVVMAGADAGDEAGKDAGGDVGGEAGVEVEGMRVSEYEVATTGSKFDLTFHFREDEQGLSVLIDYNADLFRPERMERMLGHYEGWLRSALAAPSEPLSNLEYLPAPEKEQCLREFNRTRRDYPADKTVKNLFEEQVGRTPESTAVVFKGQRLTYAELNGRANQLAHHLRTLGVGPETPVAVMTERSVEMMIAVLGVVKAGGAYVPVDPQYPEARRSFMLKDARARVILTQHKFLPGLSGQGARALALDADWPLIAGRSADNPGDAAGPANLVYVLYTSGSTGQPKGVMISHRGLVNYLDWAISAYPIEKGNGAPVHSPLGFDLTVTSIYPALLTGRRVVLLPEEEGVDALLNALREEGDFGLVKLTPAHLEVLSAQASGADVSRWARAFVIGGDALFAENLEVWRKNAPGLRLINEYGPTETVVGCSVYEVSPEEELAGAVPIGRPIGNTQLYVLDAHWRPTPIGAAGELYIGGNGLARGYHGRPALTAERFIPHPFAERGGERLYRTGDVARRLPDGALEFLGRRDDQVKVRGFRVELREVEHALLALDSVRQALVTTAADSDGSPQLVAYYTSTEELTDAELRRQLRRHLPDYMLPAFFVRLEAFPLTANGKIDRRALPAPQAAGEEEFVAARTPAEKEMARLWAEVLGVERVGLKDNFFNLGGHSLKATRVVALLYREMGLKVELRSLFLHPTLEAFAATVAAQGVKEQYRAIKVVDEQEHYELSHAQRRLWVLDQLEDETTAYTMAGAYRLEGRIEQEALGEALRGVVERHESLRTVFVTVDGEPRQKVKLAEDVNFTLRFTDSRRNEEGEEEPGEQAEARAAEAVRREAAEPFDLEAGPLLRARLVRVADEDHLLVLAMHHIVGDGWSVGLLIREVLALYRSHTGGDADPLAPLRIQYKDYAQWQNEKLRSGLLDEQRRYWLDQLALPLPVLELASDFPRPAVKSNRGAGVRRRLDAALLAQLKQTTRQNGSSLFMALVAGVGSLLWRMTGQDEMVLGTPVAGRVDAELEGQVGFYVNTLALRLKVEEQDSFDSLIERVKGLTVEGYERQEYPFDLLVEELGVERDLSRSAVFDVMVVMADERARRMDAELEGMRVSEYGVATTGSKFDLTFYFAETADGVEIALSYNADLFRRERMERMLGHYEGWLRSALAAPSEALSKRDYMTEREKAQLLCEFNPHRRAPFQERTVQELFEAQVSKTPDAVALVYEQKRLSFRQLNEQSNRVAHFLRRAHLVGPGQVVAFQLARSEKLIVAMLGVIKAGAAYLPIDARQPDERRNFILEDSGARILITDERINSAAEGVAVLSWDRELSELAQTPCENPPAVNKPDDDLYVIYTSGTTGLPKGAAIRHRSLVNYLNWFVSSFGIGEDDGTALFSSVAFDLPYTALWSALVAGAALHVLPESEFFEPEALLDLMSAGRVTYLKLTPSHLKLILNEEDEGGVGACALRLMVTGGEEINPQDVAAFFARHPDVLFVNHYGPTETTVGTVATPITRADMEEFTSQPVIGRPVFNNRVYILDKHLSLLPIGAVGEICVSGAGVARGYLNRDDLTAEKFVANPYAEAGHERLYRTGDLGRWTPNGAVQFLGRRDDQVKVRGYRVELGEVESALLTHPSVEKALIIAAGDAAGAGQLVAYLVATAPLATADLRAHLKARLPDYMIPSAFVQLEQFPLTPNGKINRRALPAPGGNESESQRGYVAPSGRLERGLALIWEEVLERRPIGAADNFFEVGGNSLRATRVVSRVARDLRVRIKLRTLFANPTIAGLAGEIAARSETKYATIKPVAPREFYTVSHAQKRLWVLHNLSPGQVAYNMPGAFVLEGDIDVAAFEAAFMALIARHETLRTTFVAHDGEPKQKIHAPDSTGFKFLYDDVRGAPDGEDLARRAARQDAATGFDLERGPLVRARLLRLGESRWVLLFNMHHIISDGWSRAVLLKEVLALYDAFKAGRAGTLPPLRVQYKDFAAWQDERLRGENLERLAGYWADRLGDPLPVLALPLDYPRPPAQTFDGAHVRFEVGPRVTAKLVELANRESATLFAAAFAAYGVLLHHVTRQRRMILGTSVAGRNHSDLEPLIGFFINTLAIRIDVDPQASFTDLLKTTHRNLLEDFEHQDLPFDLLVQRLRVKRDASVSPVFQGRFVFNDLESGRIIESAPQTSGLRVVETFAEAASAKFDLSTLMWREGEQLVGHMEYRTALFKRATVERLGRQFRTLLGDIAGAPEKRIDQFAFESAEQLEAEKGRKEGKMKAELAMLKSKVLTPARPPKRTGG